MTKKEENVSVKKCSKCNKEKSLDNFSNDSQKSCGKTSRCKDCINKNYLENKENISIDRKNYYIKNKNVIKHNSKKKYWENPLKNRESSLVYYYNNKDKKRVYSNNYNKERLKTDIDYRIRKNIRSRTYTAIRNKYKSGSSIKDLGCSIEELKVYFSSLFSPEMNWDNYGHYWHIDHKIPLSLFNLSNVNCFKKAVHYTNLQPLEKIENIKKGNKHD